MIYRPRFREHATIFGVPCSATRQQTEDARFRVHDRLDGRVIAVVDGKTNLHHGQNGVARNPCGHLTDRTGGHDQDDGD